MADSIAVIILTFNSAAVIERTLRAALRVSPRVICVDSGSTDATVEIIRAMGGEVHARPFKHYADQRNWAITTFSTSGTWQLHLDADEVLDDPAIAAVTAAVAAPGRFAGFLLRRRTYFLGRELRFGGASSWHLRLFRSGEGRCEDRLYDQHFICHGPTLRLRGSMHDLNVSTLSEWIARHNRWSDLEVGELLRPPSQTDKLAASLTGDPRERRRALKGLYYRAPLFVRAWGYWAYRYFVQLGVLDGETGFLYAFLQALWFRMLVDAKLREAKPSASERGDQSRFRSPPNTDSLS